MPGVRPPFHHGRDAPASAVIKRSGATEPFSRPKVLSGVRKACQGRPVDEDDLALLAQRVEEAVRATGAAEVDAHEVGLAILEPLRELDEVAYLRFASVYQAFDSLEDFETAITAAARRACAHRRRAGRAADARRPTPPSTAVDGTAADPRHVGTAVQAQDTGHDRSTTRKSHDQHDDRDAASIRRRRTHGPSAAGQGPDRRAHLHHARRAPLRRGDLGAARRRPANWKTGETIFEQRGVEFPDFWSVNASNIVTTKYFRGAVGTEQRETGLKQLIDRVVLTYAKAGERPRLLRDRRRTPRCSSTS